MKKIPEKGLKPRIQSETSILWELLKGIILLPLGVLLAIFGKKSFDILKPFKNFFSALIQPKFTTFMIILNVAIFIAMIFIGEEVFLSLASYPSDMLSSRVYTLITSGFLHASIIHLLGNLLALFIFGRVVEKELGSGKTAFIYLGSMILSGVISSLVSILFTGENIPGVGASGAIMGLVSTAILLRPFTLVYEFIIPIPVIVLGWLAILADITGILLGADDGIGHFAHLGGFITIFIMLPFLKEPDRAKLKKGIWVNLITLAIFAVIYYLVV